MAIFDALTFNPQGFGGQGGNLLDFLRTMQMQQQVQPSAGFSDGALPPNAQPAQGQMNLTPDRMVPVGDYQMPQFGSPAPMNANAQMQAPSPQPENGLGDRLMAGLQGFANGGAILPAIAGGISGLVNGNAPVNQTQQALIQRGLDPDMARIVSSDPGLLRAVLPSLMGTGGQTDDIKEYQFAKREDPSLTFDKFMQRKKSVSGEYSLNPIYGTDAQGNTVLMQAGKSGEAIQTKLPPGVKVSSGVEKIDLGTSWGLIDKRTGILVGQQAKDVAGKEAAEARGKAQGDAQVQLPGAVTDAQMTSKKINELLAHPGLDSIVGSLDQYRPNWTLDAQGKDARARLEQLQGTAFLQAFTMLKGGGTITEIEGLKAEQAMARMNTAQSEPEFRQALKDFRDAVEIGVQKLRQRAGQAGGLPPGVSQPASAPTRIRLNADGTIAQ